MTRPVIVAVLVCLLTPALASAQGLDGLYLEMTMRSGRIETNHYFFLTDGRYLNGVPEGGLTADALERTCAQPANSHGDCGTYRLTGGNIVFAARTGPADTRAFERLPDGNINLDGHFAKRVGGFAKGHVLEGKYTRVNSAGPIGYGETFTFGRDGTFSTTWLAGVSTAQGIGKSGGAATGTYRLDTNVLALTANGTVTRMVVYPYDLGNGDVRLNLNGEFFKK